MVRYKRVHTWPIEKVMPQDYPALHDPSDFKRLAAETEFRKQKEAEGFYAVRFQRESSGRIYVYAWHQDEEKTRLPGTKIENNLTWPEYRLGHLEVP